MSDPEIEMLAPGALRPWARNARTHSDRQIRQIAESIRTFGFTSPVLIDGGDWILAGHGRVEAARLLALDAVPCVRLAAMTAERKRAYVLADNKLALNAGWDGAILAEELEALSRIELDFDVAVTGFTLPEIGSLCGDAVADGPEDDLAPGDDPGPGDSDYARAGGDAGAARCRAGDIWRLGPHRLICGGGRDADPAGCERIIRCWEAFAGGEAEQVACVKDAFGNESGGKTASGKAAGGKDVSGNGSGGEAA